MQMMQIGAALMPVDLAQLQGGIPIVLGTIAIAGTSGNEASPGNMCHRNHGSNFAGFASAGTGTISVGMLCMQPLNI